jgi:hypothetical protein
MTKNQATIAKPRESEVFNDSDSLKNDLVRLAESLLERPQELRGPFNVNLSQRLSAER